MANLNHVRSSVTISVGVQTEALVTEVTDKDATMHPIMEEKCPLVVETAEVGTFKAQREAVVAEATDEDVSMHTIAEIRAAWKLTEETNRLLSRETGTRNFVRERWIRASPLGEVARRLRPRSADYTHIEKEETRTSPTSKSAIHSSLTAASLTELRQTPHARRERGPRGAFQALRCGDKDAAIAKT
ncbi:hypothetical protein C8R44DRAFT_751383 [Mycena epipterygia]|nr:hypothetical protein C8R44DRAFT_751383 [Mycena epipterygia]